MSEFEYNRLLETVRMAIEPAPQDELLGYASDFAAPALAANDNNPAWPLIPFPDDWYASF